MEALEEIVQFLGVDTRLDLQAIAVQHVLSLTGTSEGRDLILSCPDVPRQLILLIQLDKSRITISKDAALALVNISGDESGAKALLLISEASKMGPNESPTDDLIHVCISFILDRESSLADPCCMILSNITRPASHVDRIVAQMEKGNYSWNKIVHAFAFAKSYNKKGASLHYLGPVLSNLSQSETVRRRLMDQDNPIIQKLLPFTEYQESIVRRGGVVGTIKNCCFDDKHHLWLLSEDIDLLPHLLLPLAGPEEFDDEDNEKLPLDLQFLAETKTRERDPDIRIMILEALCQLCATREAREVIRGKNAYVILREYHKWEKDKAALLACENVIDILIRTEDEIGLENLKLVDVPEDYTEKFKKMDEDFLKDD
ncbi:protein HGH1 homolog [Diachasmimorpha longicaudata]|uniref:protein HGH1 homolog n=1 Tax=Diachasmimorpha longicaudata TaxID=58733 RepID=UPI0030B90D14